MSTFAERLKKRMAEVGLTQEKLAERVGLSQAMIQKYTSGQSQKTSRILDLAKALECDPEWLEKGIFPSREKATVKGNAQWAGDIEPWDSNTPLERDEVELPFYSEIELAAGAGSSQIQENSGFKLRFAKSTLRKSGVDEKNAACVVAKGESMEPVIPNGSTVGIDLGATSIIDGKMYAIDHEGMLRIKLLYRMPGGGIRLKSFNTEEYPDETYPSEAAEKIRIIGKVFWYSVLL